MSGICIVHVTYLCVWFDLSGHIGGYIDGLDGVHGGYAMV